MVRHSHHTRPTAHPRWVAGDVNLDQGRGEQDALVAHRVEGPTRSLDDPDTEWVNGFQQPPSG